MSNDFVIDSYENVVLRLNFIKTGTLAFFHIDITKKRFNENTIQKIN